MSMLDNGYIWLQVRANKAKEDVKAFLAEQSGVSNVVATIIVLLITVLLIAAFWTQLKTWVQGLMGQIFGVTFKTPDNFEGL